jgi:hypothetical protein
MGGLEGGGGDQESLPLHNTVGYDVDIKMPLPAAATICMVSCSRGTLLLS